MVAILWQNVLCGNGRRVLADLFRLLLLDPLVGRLEVVGHLRVDRLVHLLLRTGRHFGIEASKLVFFIHKYFCNTLLTGMLICIESNTKSVEVSIVCLEIRYLQKHVWKRVWHWIYYKVLNQRCVVCFHRDYLSIL